MIQSIKKTTYLFGLALSTMLLSACAQQSPVISTPEPTHASTEADITPMKKTEKVIVYYQCERDMGEVEMRFFPQHGVAVLVLDGQTHELQQQPAASGMWYSNGRYTFRGKGQQGWLEIGRMAAIDCVAK